MRARMLLMIWGRVQNSTPRYGPCGNGPVVEPGVGQGPALVAEPVPECQSLEQPYVPQEQSHIAEHRAATNRSPC